MHAWISSPASKIDACVIPSRRVETHRRPSTINASKHPLKINAWAPSEVAPRPWKGQRTACQSPRWAVPSKLTPPLPPSPPHPLHPHQGGGTFSTERQRGAVPTSDGDCAPRNGRVVPNPRFARVTPGVQIVTKLSNVQFVLVINFVLSQGGVNRASDNVVIIRTFRMSRIISNVGINPTRCGVQFVTYVINATPHREPLTYNPYSQYKHPSPYNPIPQYHHAKQRICRYRVKWHNTHNQHNA